MDGADNEQLGGERDDWRARRARELNYRGRVCLTCREPLRLHERKYHKGLCALAGKNARQKRRRAARRRARGTPTGAHESAIR